MKIKYGIFDYYERDEPGLLIGFIPRCSFLSGCINDDIGGGKNPLKFINDVMAGKIKKVPKNILPRENEFWTTVYTVQVAEKDKKKMFKIFFRLAEDQGEPIYIEQQELKEILEDYIKEKKKFDQNPEEYKIQLAKNGAKVINIEDYKNDGAGCKKTAEEAEKGFVMVKNEEEKRRLENFTW